MLDGYNTLAKCLYLCLPYVSGRVRDNAAQAQGCECQTMCVPAPVSKLRSSPCLVGACVSPCPATAAPFPVATRDLPAPAPVVQLVQRDTVS